MAFPEIMENPSPAWLDRRVGYHLSRMEAVQTVTFRFSCSSARAKCGGHSKASRAS
jgi:hypothetical protein